MKKVSIVLILIFATATLLGQTYDQQDTDALIEQALLYNEQLDIDTSIELTSYLNEKRSLNQSQQTRLRCIQALQRLNKGDVPNALYELKTLLQQKEQVLNADPFYKALVLHGLGKAYLSIKNNSQAKLHYNQAMQTYQRAKATIRANKVSTEYALSMMFQGNYLECLSYLTQSMELLVSLDTTKQLTQTHLPKLYMNLAITQNRLGHKALAVKYARQAIHYGQMHQDEYISSFYATLASINRSMGNYDEALNAYKTSLVMARDKGMTRNLRMALSNIAHVFSVKGEMDSAIHYLRNGAKIGDISDFHLQDFNLDLAQYYQATNQLDSAIFFAHKAETFADCIDNYQILKDSYSLLSNLYFDKGETAVALDYQKRFKTASDSIMIQASAREYAELNLKLQTLDKEHELAKLSAEMDSQRKFNIALVALMAVAVIALVFIVKYWLSERRRKNLEINNILVSKKSIESDLKSSQQELADSAVRLLAQQQFLEELETTMKSNYRNQSSIDAGTARQIDKVIRLNKATANEWDTFISSFGNAHSDFFNKLKVAHPSLTSGELKHCALLKMNTSVKQAAQLLGVDQKSVTQARYRLKKKMNLTQQESIHEAIYRF